MAASTSSKLITFFAGALFLAVLMSGGALLSLLWVGSGLVPHTLDLA